MGKNSVVKTKKKATKAKKVTYAIESCMGNDYGVFKIPHKVRENKF